MINCQQTHLVEIIHENEDKIMKLWDRLVNGWMI
jgi:hypothetical protein